MGRACTRDLPGPLLQAMNLEVACRGRGISGERVCKLDQTTARRK